MIREVNLKSYLPPFLQLYRELDTTFNTEDKEFLLVWNAVNCTLYNEFIATADEYGITRFEKILGILPDKEATLESRRLSVQTAWISTLPYTIKMLINKMISLYGDNNFIIKTNFYDTYELNITLEMNMYSQYKDLVNLLELMVPVNITINVNVEIPISLNLNINSCVATSYVPIIQIGENDNG